MTSITMATHAQAVRINSGAIRRRSLTLMSEVVLACNSSILFFRALSLDRRSLSRNYIIRSDLLHNCIHRLLNVFKKRLRIDADPQREDHQRRHVSPLAPVEIGQPLVLRIVGRAEEHALVQPEEVTDVE